MKNKNKQIEELALSALIKYRQASELGKSGTLKQSPPKQIEQAMSVCKWIKNGGLNASNLSDFLTPYLEHSQHMHSPGFIGHQVAVPHKGASIADMVHGFINNPMAVYEMGPSASVIERVVINWMLEKIGWFEGGLDNFEYIDKNGGGVLTHGGSLANLTAVLAARAKAYPNAWQEGTPKNSAMIVPEASHYSMARAVSIAGFGTNAICPAPVDSLGRLLPEKLQQIYDEAKSAGKNIFMVSANACSTATGLYDPIDEIADFCQANNLWLHIDGAHGASALISDKTRHLLKGVYRADSIVWDAHKMLRTSALCAGVLFRNAKNMAAIFNQKASYIFYDGERVGFDAAPYALECTKSALGTKLFLVLAMEGEKGLGDFVAKQYQDTIGFYELINSQTDFECPYKPESNILCFRYKGVSGNQAQLSLREKLIAKGNFYITTAEIDKVRYLRLSVMNPLTNLDTIKDLLAEIRFCAKDIK